MDDIIVSAPFELATSTSTELTIKLSGPNVVFNPVKEAGIYYSANQDAVVVNDALGAKFFIYSTAGVLLKSEVISNQNSAITLNDLSKGIYICKVEKDSQNIVTKILR